MNGAAYEYRFEDYVFRSDLMRLERSGDIVAVERRPLEILLVLLENANEVVSKEELLDRVWPDIFTVENVIANAIAKLRKALGATAGQRIVTHPRIGYRFEGDVERIAAGRKLNSALKLEPGMTAPLRDHFELLEQLSDAPSREVWRARHRKTGELRIFKYARDGAGLASIKREITIFRLARSQDGDAPMARLIDWNLAEEPFFLEAEDGGLTLETIIFQRKSEHTPEAQVAWVAAIAEAVDRIHSVGAVHGDLKPSNICIADTGAVKLIDFGSARFLDLQALEGLGVTPLGLTRTVDQGGATPIYVAPERLSGGALTPAGDVYSLGVILYQVVTGEQGVPMPSDWRTRVVCPVLRRDIEDTTRSDPAERPTSAGALALRLRALEARREEFRGAQQEAERIRRSEAMLREAKARRPWLISTAAVLVIGLVSSLFFAAEARRSATEARDRTAELAATNDFLNAMMRAGDPRTPGPGADATVTELVEHARDILVEPRFDAPGLQIQLRDVLADIHVGLSLHEGEISLRADLVERLDREAGTAERASARFDLADAYMRASLFDEAHAALRAGEALAEGATEVQLAVQSAMTRGRYHLLRFEYGEAAPAYEAALDMIEAQPSFDVGVHHAALQDLSQAYSRLDRHDEAIAILERSLRPPFSDGGVAAFRLAGAQRLLGAAHVYAGRYEPAEVMLLNASQSTRRVYGDASTQAQEIDNDLAVLYSDTGRWPEAAALLNRLRALNCERYGETHMRCLAYSGNAGVTMIEAGEFAEAAQLIDAARSGFTEALGEDAAPTQLMEYHLANALLEIGAVEGAAELVSDLDEAALSAASPTSRWDLYLPVIRDRIRLRSNPADPMIARQALTANLDRLEDIDPDLTLVARARRDLSVVPSQ